LPIEKKQNKMLLLKKATKRHLATNISTISLQQENEG
jgi:hypothetical protein